jgi:hypothetical protein
VQRTSPSEPYAFVVTAVASASTGAVGASTFLCYAVFELQTK